MAACSFGYSRTMKPINEQQERTSSCPNCRTLYSAYLFNLFYMTLLITKKKKKSALGIQTVFAWFSIKILIKTKHSLCFKQDEALCEFCFVSIYLSCGWCTLESGQQPETGSMHVAECFFIENSHHPVPSSNLGIINIQNTGFSHNSPLPAVRLKPKCDTKEFSLSLLKSTDVKTY